MFRRSVNKLSAQLIHEPLPNTEHSTLARGKMATGELFKILNVVYAGAAAGAVLAGAAVYSSTFGTRDVVSPTGEIRRE
jgi:hypothetical protein